MDEGTARRAEEDTSDMQDMPPLSMPMPRSRPPSFQTTEGSLAPRLGQTNGLDVEHILETAGDNEEYDINGNIIPRR